MKVSSSPLLSLVATTLLATSPVAAADKPGVSLENPLQANLVIYRPGQSVISRNAFYRVSVDGADQGRLLNKRYIALNVPAGTHHIRANDPANSSLEVQVDAGGVIYIRGTVESGGGHHLEMTPVEEHMAIAELPALRPPEQVADQWRCSNTDCQSRDEGAWR